MSTSSPANVRTNANTATLVVKALRKTVPVGVPSGYASVIQVCSSGKAALIPKAIRITHPAIEPSRLIGPNSIDSPS